MLGVGDTPHDTGLVHDFNPAEQQRAQDGGRRFRWTRGTSEIDFPGIGRGTTAIDLLLSGSTNPNPDVTILANDAPIATLHLTPDFRAYHVEAPAAVMTHGSLELTFAATPFQPRGDRRTLGIVVQEVRLHAPGHGLVLPPARIALSLWVGVICVALALLIAGLGGAAACAGAAVVAAGMAAFLVWNRIFLTPDAGGVVRAGVLMVAVAAAIRLLMPPLSRRLGLPTTARDVRWLAVIAAFVLALRFAGVLHPDIIVGDLTFHVHRFEDIAIRHTLILPVESKEFGGRTILYAPTPYLAMLPLSWVIHDRVLMLFLFALGIDALRFCIIWYVARRVTDDLIAANLVVLVMGLVPVGWIVYSWGIFANIFAEGMLTLLFALLILAYDRLAGPRRWWWCTLFAAVISLTLLAHVGVFVLTTLTVVLYLLGRVVQNLLRHERPWANGVIPFMVAGLAAAAIAFALFYRFPPTICWRAGRRPRPSSRRRHQYASRSPAPHLHHRRRDAGLPQWSPRRRHPAPQRRPRPRDVGAVVRLLSRLAGARLHRRGGGALAGSGPHPRPLPRHAGEGCLACERFVDDCVQFSPASSSPLPLAGAGAGRRGRLPGELQPSHSRYGCSSRRSCWWWGSWRGSMYAIRSMRCLRSRWGRASCSPRWCGAGGGAR